MSSTKLTVPWPLDFKLYLFFRLLYSLINGVQILNEADCIGCLNIHGTHVTANNSTTNNIVLFFVSDSIP